MADLVYNEYKLQQANGGISLLTDTIKIMLVTSDYTPDPDHRFIDEGTDFSPVNFELSGTGYTPGFGSSDRLPLQNKSIVSDTATNRSRLIADNVIWSPIAAGVTGACIIVKENTSDADSPLIAYIQSGGFPLNTDGGELQIRWSSGGILTFS